MSDNSKKEFLSKLDSVSVHEYTKKSGRDVAKLSLNLPMSHSFCGFRTIKEYHFLATEQVRLDLSIIFELIGYISNDIDNGDLEPIDGNEWIRYLSNLGEGYTELLDLIEMDFRDIDKTIPDEKTASPNQPVAPAPQTSAPLDLSACAPEQLNTKLSELPTMKDFACALSGLLHNPMIPDKLFNIIADQIGEHAEDWEDPVLVQKSLEQMKKKGKSK